MCDKLGCIPGVEITPHAMRDQLRHVTVHKFARKISWFHNLMSLPYSSFLTHRFYFLDLLNASIMFLSQFFVTQSIQLLSFDSKCLIKPGLKLCCLLFAHQSHPLNPLLTITILFSLMTHHPDLPPYRASSSHTCPTDHSWSWCSPRRGSGPSLGP